MTAINKSYWFKEHLMLRIYGMFFWSLGFLIFLLLASSMWIGSVDITEHNIIIFFIKSVLLFPGLIPLIVGGFFLVLFRRSEDFFLGAFVILPAFVVLHYVVAAVSAHDDGWRYLCFQLFEVACAVAVIIKFKRKWSVPAKPVSEQD